MITRTSTCGALLMFLVMYFIRRDGLRHPELESFHTEILEITIHTDSTQI